MSTLTPEQLAQALRIPLVPSFKAAAATGFAGFLAGGGFGVLRSAHPGLAAIFTGTQGFVFGGSFLYTRETILTLGFAERTRKAEIISSTVAGSVSGAAAGAFYGRVNSVAGAVVVATFASIGQIYFHSTASSEPSPRDRRPFLDRFASSKWIPLKPISNSDYETMLTEKLLRVETEIAMIDDKIAALKNSPLSTPSESTTGKGNG